jgi:hypothetical protein
MAFGTPKRSLPKPDLIGPHRSPSRQEVDGEQAAQIRRWVLTSLLIAAGVGAVGFAAYGPWWRITSIHISGTRLIEPASVTRVTNRYLDQYRWLILPNRTSWVLSSHGLEQHLTSVIRQRISVESVVVTKQKPHGLTIAIAERVPVAIWTNGSTFGSIDRHGVIIESRAGTDATLPTIADENAASFTVDSSVVKQEVVSAIATLQGELSRAHIAVQQYIIPKVTCLEPVTVPSNTNSAATNTNQATNRNVNDSTTSNVSANTNTQTITTPCDAQALRYSSQEIHVQLTDGPRVLFDRQNDIPKAVATLQRVLTQAEAKSYQSIDVRFGDRVFVK